MKIILNFQVVKNKLYIHVTKSKINTVFHLNTHKFISQACANIRKKGHL